ncbi:MAG: hypothetical protein JSS32_07420 [Verrucomicrobia bacterium]|nr:hypothetical protein [Verrucomicrobiota bacterium]
MNNKFETLRPWLKDILSSIKRDIKADYLPADKIFYRAHFGNRPLNRLSADEIYAAFEKELLAGNESLAEWVVNHWVFQHGELYDHFAEQLSQINPEFDEVKELTEAQTTKILAGTEAFGAIQTYLFSVLNAVVFPASTFEKLRQAAILEKSQREEAEASQSAKESLEQTIEIQQREIARLQDKCESKVAGVLKKYTTDTEALKKQIKALQQKLNGCQRS